MEQRRSACPLDCPDLCGLTVTVDNGRVVEVDGDRRGAAHRRLHLRQGPQDRRSPVRRRSRAAPDDPHGREGQRAVAPGDAGTKRSTSIAARIAADPRALGRRGDPAVPLRRLERLAHRGRARDAVLPPARRVEPRSHVLRGRDHRGDARPLRRDAGRRARGLRAREADRAVGREPVGDRHPPRADDRARARSRREARRDRSAAHAARAPRRSAPRGSARRRSAGRARDHPRAVRARPRRPRVPRRARGRGRRAARARGARGRSRPRRARPSIDAGGARSVRRALRAQRRRR